MPNRLAALLAATLFLAPLMLGAPAPAPALAADEPVTVGADGIARRADGLPLFHLRQLAGGQRWLVSRIAGGKPGDALGFVVVTRDGDEPMLELHGRKQDMITFKYTDENSAAMAAKVVMLQFEKLLEAAGATPPPFTYEPEPSPKPQRRLSKGGLALAGTGASRELRDGGRTIGRVDVRLGWWFMYDTYGRKVGSLAPADGTITVRDDANFEIGTAPGGDEDAMLGALNEFLVPEIVAEAPVARPARIAKKRAKSALGLAARDDGHGDHSFYLDGQFVGELDRQDDGSWVVRDGDREYLGRIVTIARGSKTHDILDSNGRSVGHITESGMVRCPDGTDHRIPYEEEAIRVYWASRYAFFGPNAVPR